MDPSIFVVLITVCVAGKAEAIPECTVAKFEPPHDGFTQAMCKEYITEFTAKQMTGVRVVKSRCYTLSEMIDTNA